MSESYTLIISEKPQAALRIAEALAESKIKKVGSRAYWLEFERNGKKHIVVPAVGHLFTLDTKKGDGWNYPTFNVEWIPTFKKRGSEFTRIYYENIKKLVDNADEFIIATDYDIEGEVIAYNILRFLCKRNDAKRMKFSTLTKDDLIEAYENMMPHIDYGQAEAGLTRHYLDFFWGINTTRALTKALRESMGRGFIIVSSGRVQSPTLKILLDRELEIRKFVPTPYWQLELHCTLNGQELIAYFKEDRIWEREKAEKILEECKGKDAIVKKIEKRTYKQKPPIPFDTTSLQTEAYRCFGFSPTRTLNIAEALYNQALISYPRTASQKLPPRINYSKILQGLSKQKAYDEFCAELLVKEELKPNEGKRSDPAHVAIYPTGEIPKKLTPAQRKLYDLIVRRFLAVFHEAAIRESMKVSLDVNGHEFILSGKRTVSQGWFKVYSPYVKLEEQILPELKEGQVLKFKEILMLDKETQPPNRYSQGSIIKEMEARGLGTKATRAEILKTLYDRGYIRGKSIEVTKFGEKVIEVLAKYCPKIVSEELTRKFEEEMELVREGRKKKEEVIGEAKEILLEILRDFEKNKDKIGKGLLESYISYKRNQKYIGKCPKCGGELKIIVSRRTGKRFVGCSNYKNGCDFSTPLPQRGIIKPLNKVCSTCGYPMISVQIGKKFFNTCININCPSKEFLKNKKKN